MKKLFQAIRHYDMDEVKAILAKHPDALHSVAAPPPKKDIGQSPLQVAIKICAFDIAAYLIEQGADINFMEENMPGTSLRCPLLHDAIGAVMFCLMCSGLMPQDEIARHIADAERAFSIVEMLCEHGADVQKTASNEFDALNHCVHAAEKILDNADAYSVTQKEAEEYFVKLLDILTAHGADLAAWAKASHYPPADEPAFMNQFLFIDDYIPDEANTPDKTAHTRAVMQQYIKDRRLTLREKTMFLKFHSQDERRAYGGSCFIELQFCKLSADTALNDILQQYTHWQNDSLYVHDDAPLYTEYGAVFGNGVHPDLTESYFDGWGVTYYRPDQIEGIIQRAAEAALDGCETLIEWLNTAKQYHGFYILGV